MRALLRKDPMGKLFSPITLRGLTLPNRIFISPMCQYSATNGAPNAWHAMHLLNLAISGAGILCIEGTAVVPEGRITPGDLGLWDETTQAAFVPVLAGIREHTETAVMIQLAHAGRKGSSYAPWESGAQIPLSEGGWVTPSASAVPHKQGETPPVALDEPGLQAVIDRFAQAARRADQLGIDAIEVHGAHGYLIHQFLSPISNQRTDSYGGSLENRMRFPLRLFQAVRAAFPAHKPIGMKISAVDWMAGGWDLPQSVVFARALKELGADWITASSAGISPLQKIAVAPDYQVPFAAGIRADADITTVAVGLITEPAQAERIVSSGQADMVALARAMLYDPRWPWHAAAALGATVKAPPQYWRSQPRGLEGLFGATSTGQR